MTYKVQAAPSVEKVIAKWKKSNPNLHKKFKNIIKELTKHPRKGIGHPEPLVGMGNITWSRRISANDRIIYDIHDDIVTVIIVQVGNHYSDK